MKCYLIKLLMWLLVLPFILFQTAFANSGPTYWQGYPSSDVLAVDENSPVEVESEKLIFDFSGDSSHNHTIRGQVTASYEMVNPEDKDLSVQMAFPFVGSLNDFSLNDIEIRAGETVLPYDLYIGDVVNSYGDPRQQENGVSFAFADIIGTITNKPYEARHFSEYEKGRLYTIEVKPATEQGINLAIDFEFDSEKTRVLTNGFNRYERDGRKVRIASWCYGPEILEIFVLGDNVDFNITAYTDGELKKKTDLVTYKTSSRETEVKTYIMDYIKEYVEKAEPQPDNPVFQAGKIPDSLLYNLYASALDKAFTDNQGYCDCFQLIDQNHYERILTLVYTVDFPANSRRNVSVSYKASGTMDKTKTVKPLYTFDYILNPAKNWSSFKNLSIQVVTPEEAPHIVDSSIELTKEGDRHYTAKLDSLPDKDFTFSIYGDEKITLLDRTHKTLQKIFGYFMPFIIGGLLILTLVVVSAVVIRSKRIKF